MRFSFPAFAVRFSSLFVALALFAGPGRAEPRFTATVSGEGPDVILIPGLASPASIWDATVARLKAGRRLHVLQVAGFAGAPVGGNEKGPVVGPLVEEIAAYIAAQKLSSPAIIGHSLGGAAALMLAARHPSAVGRVLAVDALPFFPVTMNPAATVEETRPMADLMQKQIAGQSPEMFAASQGMILQRMVKDESARAALVPETAKSDPKVVAAAFYDLMTTDLRPELAAIQVPLTVLYARDESLVPARIDPLFRASYANAKSARLIGVDGALHFIMFDQPEKFATAVDDFLK
jgi:pimeloyl-ACP methyl ester carboxylesterase